MIVLHRPPLPAIVAKVHARPTSFLCVFPRFSYSIQQKKHTSEQEKLFRQPIPALWSVARTCFADGAIIAASKGRVYSNKIKRPVQEGRELIFEGGLFSGGIDSFVHA